MTCAGSCATSRLDGCKETGALMFLSPEKVSRATAVVRLAQRMKQNEGASLVCNSSSGDPQTTCLNSFHSTSTASKEQQAVVVVVVVFALILSLARLTTAGATTTDIESTCCCRQRRTKTTGRPGEQIQRSALPAALARPLRSDILSGRDLQVGWTGLHLRLA